MKKQYPLFNQNGSLRHGIGLLLVIMVVIILFYFIGEFETKSEDYGFRKDTEESSESGDSFYEGEKTQSGRSQNTESDYTVDEKDVSAPEDPNEVGKSSKDAFYEPPSPEKRREMDSQANKSSGIRP
ncbi:MAG: hypothetical protein CVU48_06460 [Candidatus Cloacimonetes bacterium HGW-Cloacimonetes-1]|nr:MAG: hypothetical protein CVU48_06460 [Candidatus Cloacimonetes bacterium HGW-Cloacimonetes-1]